MAHHPEQPLIILGNRIAPALLEKKAIRRCEIATCKGSCCSDGVWVDISEANAIRANAELIKPFMRPERRNVESWFAELHEDDPAFPSGQYTGTTTVVDQTHPNGETCIFLRPEDRYCAIQAACFARGLPPWKYKPTYCCLFPVVDEFDERGNRTVTVDSENTLFERGGGCHESCACEPQPMFQIYAEEVALALGVEGYRALCAATGETPRL